MSRLRIVRIACVVGAAGLAFAAVGARADAPPASTLPAFFGGVASTAGLFEHLDSNPGLSAVSEPVYASFGDGNSRYSPDSLRAEAAPYFPGNAVNGLPGLLCTAGLPPACTAPPLPIEAVADGNTPNATVSVVPSVIPGGTLPLSIGPLTGQAHANLETGVTTTAEVGSLDEGTSAAQAATIQTLRSTLATILGHPLRAASSSALVHVAAITGMTKQAFSGNVLHVHAEAVDTGIELLGGAVEIASAHAVSDTTADGVSQAKHSENAALAGISVAGIPATIDSHGITIAGANIPKSVLSAVTDALGQALSALGATITFVGHSHAAVLSAGACTGGEADGLQLHLSQDLRSIPIEGAVFYDDIAIGAACTTGTVAASTFGSSGGGSSGGTPAIEQGGSQASSQLGPTANPPTGSPATATPSGTPSSVALGPPSAPAAVAAPRTVLPLLEADLRVHLAAFRIKALYLSFALIGLAFLLGSPWLFPRRRKGVGNA